MKILVLGGTKYFGKRLVHKLIEEGHDVTVATRGQASDPFGNSIRRIHFDREDVHSLAQISGLNDWDIVYDQICYSPNEALSACKAFEGRAGKYVHTSTGSVYSTEGLRTENDFDPFKYPIRMGSRSDFDYSEGKRQAEAVFFQNATFPVVAMRIPIVLGPDDYTRRLEFHIDHIREGRPIVISNLDSETCFINSSETARFLYWLGTNEVFGPINGCSYGRIAIGKILELIERRLGKNAVILANGPDEDATPFVGPTSRFNDNSKASQLGFQFDHLDHWLPKLIDEIS
jgi:nucleoside-diphosphate-sugar epimerase